MCLLKKGAMFSFVDFLAFLHVSRLTWWEKSAVLGFKFCPVFELYSVAIHLAYYHFRSGPQSVCLQSHGFILWNKIFHGCLENKFFMKLFTAFALFLFFFLN